MANSNVKGVINLGTGKPRKVSEIIDILYKHFPNMKINQGTSDILYEASGANITKLVDTINWKPERDIEYAIPEMINFEKEKKSKGE